MVATQIDTGEGVNDALNIKNSFIVGALVNGSSSQTLSWGDTLLKHGQGHCNKESKKKESGKKKFDTESIRTTEGKVSLRPVRRGEQHR